MQLSARRIDASPLASATHLIRPVRHDDEIGLQHFIRNLSAASRYARFMMAIRELPDYMLARFIHPLPETEAVLVATSPFGRITGLGQYVRDDSGNGCEVAVVVGDVWQRQGLGTRLLQAVLNIARDSGLTHFHAQVLADNYPMRALARKLGCETRMNAQAGFLAQISATIGSASDVRFDVAEPVAYNYHYANGVAGPPVVR